MTPGAALSWPRLPEREREVLDSVDGGDPTRSTERREMEASGRKSEHALVIGHGDEQRAVGVAVADEGVDDEGRVPRFRGVGAVAVVHDPLEHRQRHDPHATILAVTTPQVPDESLLEQLQNVSGEIVAGVERELPGWVVREVGRILEAWGRLDPSQLDEAMERARAAGEAAAARIGGQLRQLFAKDPAEQHETPLQIVRGATVEPTVVLNGVGIPEVVRDLFDERANPSDVYDVAPRTLGDLGDPEMGSLMLAWGVAKARVLRNRGVAPPRRPAV